MRFKSAATQRERRPRVILAGAGESGITPQLPTGALGATAVFASTRTSTSESPKTAIGPEPLCAAQFYCGTKGDRIRSSYYNESSTSVMTRSAPLSTQFILEAFDCDRWCPVLQALLHVDDLDALRAILDDSATDDLDLRYTYHLDNADIAAIIARFDVAFDHRQLEASDLVVSLFRRRSRLDKTPYLVHTGYELPLLLDGRKKLAKMSAPYPPERFDGEDRFDH